MGDVEHVPNFRDWVDSILKIAPMETRTWKSISLLNGWKVKTHGFGIRGMTAEVVVAIRASSTASLDLEKTRAMLSKRKVVEESSENEEEENTSLIARPRARRRIVSENEAEVTPVCASLTEPILIPSEDETTPRDTNESIHRLFIGGFENGELGRVLDEVPLSSSVPTSSFPASLPTSAPLPALSPMTPVIFTSSTTLPSIAPPSSVQYAEEGSSSRSLAMRSVMLEVPANNNLLRKSGRADNWLRPLIGDIEKKKMDNHSCLTLMNDIVHSTLKANLIGTELIGRISLLEKKAQELLESRNLLEQQKRRLTSELAVAKASSSQFEKDKERIECLFSEQLSNCSDEIRELKVLLAKKEEYAGELVQSLTQAQADLKISFDKVSTLESSHASLEASFESSLVENQVLKNDLAMWEMEYELIEENFNIEVSWAFLNSRRDALMEASQENFDLNSELAKVLKTIERTQQPLDSPSPSIEAPVAEEPLNEEDIVVKVEVENAAIPASEGETSMTQSVEVEASVTLSSLIDPNISSSAETILVATSSKVATVHVA
ncbi:uncharacterized protein [Nicotiana sylvestris]|uniref:uncharacterized protein n=1 Tax=Nicotiana sylvestris TaxID=4096 RepID=UPI00388C6F0F